VIWSYVKRNLLRRKVRAFSIILIIALIVSMFAGFSISTRNAEYATMRVISEYMGEADIVISNATGYLSLNISQEISKIKGVEAVDYVLEVYGEIEYGNKSLFVSFLGINTEGFYAKEILGDLRQNLSNKDECIITSPIAEELNLEIGDKFNAFLVFKNKFKITKFVTRGIIEWEKKWVWDYPRLQIYVRLEALLELFSESNVISAIYVKVEPEYSIAEVGDAIKEKYPELNVYYPDIGFVKSFEQSFTSDMMYILATAIILLLIICYINIEERRVEIGTLKVLGVSTASLTMGLISEILLLSLLGVLLGVGLSFLFAFLFNSLYASILMLANPIPMIARPEDFITGIAIGIVTPLIATLIMSIFIGKIKPIEVMRVSTRVEEVKIKKGFLYMGLFFLIIGIAAIFIERLSMGFWWTRVTGLLFLIPAAFLYYLEKPLGQLLERIAGISGRLSVVFSKRRIGVSIIICIILGTSLNWLATTGTIGIGFTEAGKKVAFKDLNFEVVVTFSSPASWDVVEDIAGVEGVEDVLGIGWLGYIPLGDKNVSVSLAVVDLNKFKQFLNVEVLNGSWAELSNTSAVVFNTIFFFGPLRGVFDKDPYGANLTLLTEVGKSNVTVDLILKSYIPMSWFYAGPVSLGISIFIDKEFAKTHYPSFYGFCLFSALVKVKEGYDPQEVLENIQEKLGKNFAGGFTVHDWYEQGERISSAYSVFYYLVGYIMALIAVVIMFIIQMRNISMWRLELGTLRTFGLTRKQLIGIFLLQALVLIIPTFIAVAISYPFDAQAMFSMFKMIGMELPLILDWFDLVIFTVLLCAFLSVAAVIPAIKVAKTSIRDTLMVE